jgi:AraC family transcriptional regulator
MSALGSYSDHYTQGAFAPYVRQHVLLGEAPIALIDVVQPAGDFSDPPTSDLVLIQDNSPGARVHFDIGGGRTRHRQRRGLIHAIAPGIAASVVVDDPHAIRIICVPATVVRTWMAELRPHGSPFDFGRLHGGGAQSSLTDLLVDRLWGCPPADSTRLLADSLMIALLAELGSLDRQVEVSKGGLAPWQVKRVTEHLEANLAGDVSLAELAALVRLSSFHFCRAFRQSTGLPPQAWQRRLRCERAQELLLATDLSIGEIAVAVGYETPQAFARMFRAETGAAPTDWRRERRA